ncbi:MAG: prolipoprotein diacylglyceryl transferase [Brachybacterium sp.]|nr:prolipoprotein diacylglyceryl transferase [Brachybacterium sp.]
MIGASPLAAIPSPPINSIGIGPLTIHFYALCILAGIALAMWWASRRWEARGGDSGDMFDIAFVAVIAGIIGARVYHVAVNPQDYFGAGINPLSALMLWQGGLGIMGAVAFGAIAVYVMARRKAVSFAVLADTIAPTLLVAQAVGRLGNWFNQELYGGPTDLPWALEITCRHGDGVIVGCAPGLYHPTFLYEMLWNLAGCAVLLLLAWRFSLGGGRVFWLYAAIYASGRLVMETLRVDPATMVLGLRIHFVIAAVILVIALTMVAVLTIRRRRRGGEARAADGSFVLAARTHPQDAPETRSTP